MNKLFTPKDVAKAIGVSESSMKRWCDKGLVDYSKTVGGHRRISMGAVLRFLRRSKHRMVQPSALGLPAALGQGELSPDQASATVHQALVSGDTESALRTVYDLLIAGRSAAAICQLVLVPAMQNVHVAHRNGSLSTEKVERLTGVLTDVLTELRQSILVKPSVARSAIGCSLVSEWSWFSDIVGIVLREQGWEVTQLPVPDSLETLVPAVERLGPQALWLVVNPFADQPNAAAQIAVLSRSIPASCRVMVAGCEAGGNRRVRSFGNLHALIEQLNADSEHSKGSRNEADNSAPSYDYMGMPQGANSMKMSG